MKLTGCWESIMKGSVDDVVVRSQKDPVLDPDRAPSVHAARNALMNVVMRLPFTFRFERSSAFTKGSPYQVTRRRGSL